MKHRFVINDESSFEKMKFVITDSNADIKVLTNAVTAWYIETEGLDETDIETITFGEKTMIQLCNGNCIYIQRNTDQKEINIDRFVPLVKDIEDNEVFTDDDVDDFITAISF